MTFLMMPMSIATPEPGRFLRFRTTLMERGTVGGGISGWWDGREFWSHDLADRYGEGEVCSWGYVGSALKCQASGCDGCLSCEPPRRVLAWRKTPNVRAKRG